MDPSIAPTDPENNPYWQEYVSRDRKIFELSDPVFRKVALNLAEEKPDILLITGDLAKEGELVCHETVKSYLQMLEEAGIRVYVVPGNNDIGNPDAKTYKTEIPSAIPSITAEEFASIYEDFGFEEAKYKDVNSLSYICQPFENLWILGIDCKSGAINPLTLIWIQEKMVEANENGILVIPMMHYGILEHYTYQRYLEPLVADFRSNSTALMNAGIRLIFTGHYHASDIVDLVKDGKTLSDIQTGSLVTPPYSYRLVTLEDNVININTKRVNSPGSGISHEEFIRYSGEVFTERIKGFFTYYGSGIQGMFGIPAEQYPTAVPFFARAYMAYLAGDEKLDSEEAEKIEILGQTVPSALPLLNILWSDLLPPDNKYHISLK
jgi:hypothetical protein